MKALQNTNYFPFMQPTVLQSEGKSLLRCIHEVLLCLSRKPPNREKNIERIYKKIFTWMKQKYS
jgi:hypothetical protein